jgi:TRAP-type mannitol/chloroaromatic compound transport system permease small subunit
MSETATSYFSRWFEKLVRAVNMVATFWIFMMIMLVVLDVLGRVLINRPVTGVPEIIKISLPAITFLQIGYVLLIEGHIRSGIVLDKAGPRLAGCINIVTAILGIILFALNLYSGWDATMVAWSIGEYEGEGALRVPTAPIRTIILFGSLLMVIQFMRLMVASAKQMMKSNAR